MITIFNRKEAGMTNSMQQQALWQKALSKAGIAYSVKVVDRGSPSVLSDTRARTGSFGQPAQLAKTYYFYVKRTDYEQARRVMAGSQRKNNA